jgi:thiamine biosynthesis protein ThiS
MLLHINGESRDFPDGLTVASLVAHLGMKADRVAVELNLEIVPRNSWDATQLKDGDKLEIVHFVGGGADGNGYLVLGLSLNHQKRRKP